MQKRKYVILVMVFSFLCIFYQIIITPYIGIANNGDFERIMIPSGIVYTVNPWLEENCNDYFFMYITNAYEIVKPQYNGWFSIYQIHIFLSKLICRIFSKTGTYDLRYIGFVNMLVYLCGIYLVLCRINKEKNKMLKAALMLLVFILAVDGYVIQYMNAFYCEIGTVCALLFFYGSLSLLICYEYNQCVRIGLFSIAFCAGIAAVTVKQQDILCLFPAVGILWLVLNKKMLGKVEKKKKIGINIVVLSFFVASVVFTAALNKGGGNVGCFNVVCMNILANSKNPEQHLADMGLTEDEQKEMLDVIGQDAYSDSGKVLYPKYGEYFTRRNELKIIVKEPSILISMIRDRSERLFQDELALGNFMKNTGMSPYSKSKAFRIWSGGMKGHIYWSNIYFYLLILFTAGVVSIYLIKKNGQLGYLLITMCISNVLRFLTVILGDGSHDDIKHFFALNLEFDVIFFALIISICVTGYGIIKLNRKKRKPIIKTSLKI